MENNLSFEDIKHFSIARLTQIYILSNKLRQYLDDELVDLNNNLKSLDNNELLSSPDLMEQAKKEGIVSGRDYKKLEKTDPQRFKNIFEQNSLKFSKLMSEVNMNLHINLFPHITWSSLFLISMSHFEYSFILISNFFQDKKKIKLSLSEISGHNNYEKFKTYSLKVIELNYDFCESNKWSKIKDHQKVRNLIVHNNGILDGSQRANSVKELIDNKKIKLNYSGDLNIKLSKDYLEEVIFDLQEWLEEFYNAIE